MVIALNPQVTQEYAICDDVLKRLLQSQHEVFATRAEKAKITTEVNDTRSYHTHISYAKTAAKNFAHTEFPKLCRFKDLPYDNRVLIYDNRKQLI